MTRTKDCDVCEGEVYHKIDDLKGRVNVINKSNADIFISIHLNMFVMKDTKGFQIIYNEQNTDSLTLAETIYKTYNYYMSSSRRGIVKDENLYMLSRLTIPGCLLECGFLSNEEDRNLLIDNIFQKKLANSIFLGINNYFLTKVEYL